MQAVKTALTKQYFTVQKMCYISNWPQRMRCAARPSGCCFVISPLTPVSFCPNFCLSAATNQARACVLICNKGKLVSIFKGEIDTAVKYYHMGLKYPFGSRMTAINLIMTTFTNGLLGFICALKGGNDRNQWKNVGLGALKQMKKWAKSSEWNFSNKVFLLEAESMLIRGNFEVAKSKYEASIKAAHTHRFVHEEGLAFERAGNFYLERGKKTDAILLLGKAKACYERWGAMALVHRLDSRICHLR